MFEELEKSRFVALVRRFVFLLHLPSILSRFSFATSHVFFVFIYFDIFCMFLDFRASYFLTSLQCPDLFQYLWSYLPAIFIFAITFSPTS